MYIKMLCAEAWAVWELDGREPPLREERHEEQQRRQRERHARPFGAICWFGYILFFFMHLIVFSFGSYVLLLFFLYVFLIYLFVAHYMLL
jgi:hypothetical protein